MIVMNEKIRASEVRLTGLNGEDLGIVSREEALAFARELKADLVCTSLMSSPPPCRLVGRGQAKQQASREKRDERAKEQPAKVKELRLTPHIEEHDYDTKLRQAAKLLASGNGVQLVVRIQGKEGQQAKALLERMLGDLAGSGKKQSGIQLSGKQAAVQVLPV
ncbi:translation initiation factor IF-3 [Paenibacillus arenilitoris]|uniref:Translation initiation factor IF-3 n=1 Tax=Paenibacillus arenilitoris TaxID=2772299 RepID=A0A927HAA7_9BACL|nr:translation initiation factor IF-3 [Paenibacillus arenilitoris]MBD2872434.1 translation initiation factor IF-3 [Paenibacillus arenilitoris]